VRFLDVGAEGFLGLGKKHFLIPVEAVSGVSEEGVTLDQIKFSSIEWLSDFLICCSNAGHQPSTLQSLKLLLGASYEQ
jgi:hypothetical protein